MNEKTGPPQQPTPNTEAATTNDGAVTKKFKTAVVVHGMGEQKPLESLNGFVKTALRAPALLTSAAVTCGDGVA